jgi:AraC-like DNA-binding protein
MTLPITQAQAMAASPLSSGERAHFFATERFVGLDFLAATFSTHAYAPHTHDTYVIGCIETGCEMWHTRGRRHYAGADDLAFNNPLDVHDGIPHAGGYSYRMTYPSVALIQSIASDLCGGRVTSTPFFREPMARDPEGLGLFRRAHRTIESGEDRLAGEECLTRAYARFLAVFADVGVAPLGSERGAVARARSLIEDRYAEDLALDDFARAAGLSRHHLIRAFRREVGLTPHAYLVDVRVRRAQDLLRGGERPATVAAAVGFADQSHLTRAFKARLAVGPGAYRRAVCD